MYMYMCMCMCMYTRLSRVLSTTPEYKHNLSQLYKLTTLSRTRAAVHNALTSVVAGFRGLSEMEPVAAVTRMQDKRLREAVAVTVGNRYSGSHTVDSHISARELHDALQQLGLRVEAPWIDQVGGQPMLDKLRGVLATKVQPTDNGFIFAFCGHGRVAELCGNDCVFTSYQAIVDVIAEEPKLQGKPKLVVFDCCHTGTQPGDQFRLPTDMIVARATGFGTKAFEMPNVGNIYTSRLATEIRDHAAEYSVEDLLKLTQGAIHRKNTPTQQVAHVDSSLGAYHLHLGPEAQV